MTTRRKLLPVLAGVGALVVLTVVAFSWREIAIQYHVARLCSDSFAIYPFAEGEARRAVRPRATDKLDEFKLSDTPVFTEADIIAYDWV